MSLTLMVAWTTVVATAIAASVVVFFPFYFRHRGRHLIQVVNHLHEITSANRLVIRDPDTPEKIVAFMRQATEYSVHSEMSRFVLRMVISGDFFDAAQRAAEDKSPLSLAIEGMSPPKRFQFTRFMSHVVLCSASSDPILAAVTRRLLLFGLMKDTAHELEGSGRDRALAVEATFALPADGDEFSELKHIEEQTARENRRLSKEPVADAA